MRKRLFEIIEASNGQDTASSIYDTMMMAAILCSMIPLCFKQTNPVFAGAEAVTTVIFVLDYLMRLATADLKLKQGIQQKNRGRHIREPEEIRVYRLQKL